MLENMIALPIVAVLLGLGLRIRAVRMKKAIQIINEVGSFEAEGIAFVSLKIGDRTLFVVKGELGVIDRVRKGDEVICRTTREGRVLWLRDRSLEKAAGQQYAP